jgi:hypothetical protein
MGKISSIHDAIRSCSINPGDLSDPFKTKDIPWPSPLPLPSRFSPPNKDDATIPEGNVRTFQYMGRAMFKEFLSSATGNVFMWYRKLYLHGPSGVGKTHLLAALVFYLVQKRERVVYLPDCGDVLSNPLRCIKEALLFAFYDDRTMLKTIAAIGTLEGLSRVVNYRSPGSLYFIVDQWNALDSKGENESALKKTLDEMGIPQKYIFSASADAQSNRHVDEEQSGIQLIRFYQGMTQVCPHFSNCAILHSLGRDRRLVPTLRTVVPSSTPPICRGHDRLPSAPLPLLVRIPRQTVR